MESEQRPRGARSDVGDGVATEPSAIVAVDEVIGVVEGTGGREPTICKKYSAKEDQRLNFCWIWLRLHLAKCAISNVRIHP